MTTEAAAGTNGSAPPSETGGEAPGSPASPPPARPEWVTEDRFWDAEKGAPKVEEVFRAYDGARALIGKRVGDLSPAAKRQLAETYEEEIRGSWLAEERAKLTEDPEFLEPLKQKFLDEVRPAVEKYEIPPGIVPEGMELDPEHPLLVGLQEKAKADRWSPELFADVLKMGLELLPEAKTPEQRLAELGPKAQERALAIVNMGRTVAKRAAGNDPQAQMQAEAEVNALFREIHSPQALTALERILGGVGERASPGGNSRVEPQLTEADLRAIIRDPNYTKDPRLQQKVTEGYKRLYGDQL
jgi:hypothetical protein